MFLKPNEKEITRISLHTKIKGSLVSEGDVIIEGVFDGQIKTGSGVHVLQGAKVISSSVQGDSVRVDGVIEGEVKAFSTLALGTGGTIIGNVECRVLSIAPGAILNGQCTMVKKEKIPMFSLPLSPEEVTLRWAEAGVAYGTKQKEKEYQNQTTN